MNAWRLHAILLSLCSVCISRSEVIINEIHFDSPVKTELVEFIELHNIGLDSVVLGGWKFTAGIDYTFPANANIPAGGYVVVAQDPNAFQQKFGVSAFGSWTGLLDNDGETITLRDQAGRVVDEVDYQLGFPWPTVGEPPGYSIELLNPGLDNDLGGSWRASRKDGPTGPPLTLVEIGSEWNFFRGTEEPSSPATAWRDVAFNDAGWEKGFAPIGYDPDLPLATRLDDMRGSYTSVFLRKKFSVADPAGISSLNLRVLYDDGFKLWINGRALLNLNMPGGEAAHDVTSTGGARESADYDEHVINLPPGTLRSGENVLAIQLHNVSLAASSDAFIDLSLAAQVGASGNGPTPGRKNAVFAENVPPQVRQVEHSPEQPRAGETVLVTAKVTDPDNVASVNLLYQIVEPGAYVELNDAVYRTGWTQLPMRDDGIGGDQFAQDSVYSVSIPATIQQHRRLIRYRIVAADNGGRAVQVPYPDDPCPNFAYFVYNGVPSWSGAIQPASPDPLRATASTIPAEEMGRLPAYHLIAKNTSVEAATWTSRYTGDLYRWWGTLVYDGKVYDHVRYRARGGVWRYAMGKNMWKFDFNRGHDLEARDNYGNKYKTKWRKLNLGSCIQQGDYYHRGEQGMFESVGFRLFNLAGVESPHTHFLTFRVIDDARETGPTQYDGDFWGLYLGIEQEDGRFLDEHALPDGNLYKMESGTGELNNQGRTAASDKSDLNAFLNTYRGSPAPTDTWWRQNFDLQKYYSYQAIVQGIHHYDICYGKNYFYYLNPDTSKWSVHTWDLDLTWADNMFDAGCGGRDDLYRVLSRAAFSREYRNRIREIRDLLFNNDQAFKLIDEYASLIKGNNGGPNIVAADRAMWDYHPVMNDSTRVNLSKAGHGRFYRFEFENNPDFRGSFEGAIRLMKAYVQERGTFLDGLTAEPAGTPIPSKPTITYSGPAGYPLNRLRFAASAAPAGFSAMQWRVGEVRIAAPGMRGIYEIEPVWTSPELTTYASGISIPASGLKVGRTYRARVKMRNSAGVWSRWSAPVEFTAGTPDNDAALRDQLRVTEVMFDPPAGSEFEFIELRNTSETIPLQLAAVAFTEGIEFEFPDAQLAPGEFAIVTKAPAANDFAAFRQHYRVPAQARVFGPYSGSLNNDGERATISTHRAGQSIISFEYNNGAGWPVSASGAGHSLVPEGVSEPLQPEGALDYCFNWRPSAHIGGSPGSADPTSPPGLLINEIAAHTDHNDPNAPEYDSNDWIELINPASLVSTANYYLSDDPADLKKWALPTMNLSANTLITFDEVSGFHKPITTGFGIDKAGEQILLSYLPGTAADRVVDAVAFKGQENGFTWGRFPNGAADFYTLVPSRGSANKQAKQPLWISEVMHHSQSAGLEDFYAEYIELYNPGPASVPFFNDAGPFRVAGGVSFSFPPGVTIAANKCLLLVSFNPADSATASLFLEKYNLQADDVTLLGPYTGRLRNSSDHISLEKPELPDLPGAPIAWVVIDHAIYPFERPGTGANGTGAALQRVSHQKSGLARDNWAAAAASPGIANAFSGPLSVSASLSNGLVVLRFEAEAGKVYRIEHRDTIVPGPWALLRAIENSTGTVDVTDIINPSVHRFYRVVIP